MAQGKRWKLNVFEHPSVLLGYLLESCMEIWYIFIKELKNGRILALENLKKHFFWHF